MINHRVSSHLEEMDMPETFNGVLPQVNEEKKLMHNSSLSALGFDQVKNAMLGHNSPIRGSKNRDCGSNSPIRSIENFEVTISKDSSSCSPKEKLAYVDSKAFLPPIRLKNQNIAFQAFEPNLQNPI